MRKTMESLTRNNALLSVDVKRCEEDMDILTGKKPGVIMTQKDILDNSSVFMDSLTMPRKQYIRKHSLYYQLNPEQ
jgi:hypothetical protein